VVSGAPKAASCPSRTSRNGYAAAFLVSAHISGRAPLGKQAKSARTRITRRLPAAAAPALVGVAAALAIAGTSTSALAAQAPASAHQAAAAAAAPPAPAAARLVSASRAAAPAAARARYTVKAGDTLSGIAKRAYHDPRYWPVLYWANHKQVRYANVIRVGQVLAVPAKPAKIPAAPSVLGPAPVVSAPAPVVSAPAPVAAASAAGGSRYAAPARVASAAPAPAAATVSTAGDSSFQACVIARESGGNSQVMNASGHYGLYQFSASTWAAYGGNPASFGNASVAQQNQVFANAIAAGGQSNWSPYDGC